MNHNVPHCQRNILVLMWHPVRTATLQHALVVLNLVHGRDGCDAEVSIVANAHGGMVGTCESPTPGYCACEAVKNTIYYYNLVEWATIYVIGFETSIYCIYIILHCDKCNCYDRS